MGSINGLKNIAATSIQNSGEFYLGNQLDSGTAGQVIVSGGSNESATWGTNSATLPNALTMGTNLTLTSGNTSFDGSVADTINASVPTLTGGNGIDITGTTVTTDNDGTTINNSGGSGTQNQVLKVPNSLTSGTNVSFSSGTTYDGSTAITISSTDTNTTYTASVPVEISGSNVISLNYDEDTIDLDGSDLAVVKVPNSLTSGTNVSFSSGTTYDGSTAITISSTDTDTTYNGGTNINIDTSTNPDEINLDTTITDMTNISFLDNGTATSITGSNYPSALTTATYLDLSSSTNIIHPSNVFESGSDLRMSISLGAFLPNDDSSYFNIGVEDDLSSKIHGTIRPLTSSLEVCGYFIIPRDYTATDIRIDVTNSSGVGVSRTIIVESVITYGGTGYSALGSITTNSEQSITNFTAVTDRILLIRIITTTTSDHIRGGYIKLTR